MTGRVRSHHETTVTGSDSKEMVDEVLGPELTKWTIPAGNLLKKKLSSGVISTMATKRKANSQRAKGAKKARVETDGTLMMSNNLRSSKQTQQSIIVPRAMTTNMSKSGSIIVRNQEVWLQSTTVIGDPVAPNIVRLGSIVAPTSLGSWMLGIASQYARYRIKSLTFEYQPAVGTTTNGFVAIGFFPDPSDAVSFNTSAVPLALARLSTCVKFASSAIYAPLSMTIKGDDMNWGSQYINFDSSLGLGSPEELLRGAAKGGVGVVVNYNAASPPGNWYISYEIEFKDPTNPFINQ